MMRAPTFSVVIPTYRRAQLLDGALASVRAQVRPADEVIVVADGPDAEAETVALEGGARFLVLPHGGVARARNAGIANATGDWICFLDDDDLYHPDYLAEVEAYILGHPEAEAINAGFWRFSTEVIPEAVVDVIATELSELVSLSDAVEPITDMSYLQITGRSYAALLHGMRGNLSSSAVRKDRLLAVGGFPEGRVCAEDWTMFLNVARYTEWHVVERRLLYMRWHAANGSATRPVQNALTTLGAFRAAWEDRSQPIPAHGPLESYRDDYRYMLRSGLDSARRARDWGAYRRLLLISRGILPRRSDRLRAMIPGGVQARLRRLATRPAR